MHGVSCLEVSTQQNFYLPHPSLTERYAFSSTLLQPMSLYTEKLLLQNAMKQSDS
jgi:hypothetical protein